MLLGHVFLGVSKEMKCSLQTTVPKTLARLVKSVGRAQAIRESEAVGDLPIIVSGPFLCVRVSTVLYKLYKNKGGQIYTLSCDFL